MVYHGVACDGRRKGMALALGVETSCDETAAALVRGSGEGEEGGEVLSNVVWSQHEIHERYGGVAPEAAARAHAERLDAVVWEALKEAGVGMKEVDVAAVTAGPGLAGCLAAGLTGAQVAAWCGGCAVLGMNHLEGHVLSVRLGGGVGYPYLALGAWGGHGVLAWGGGGGSYRVWGRALDDAPGEAFDKVARVLGLGYPGGALLEGLAREGDLGAVETPRPLLGRGVCDFSFSGLKTAARRLAEGGARGADVAASFQESAAMCMLEGVRNGLMRHREWLEEGGYGLGEEVRLAVVGGVAANGVLRGKLEDLARIEGVRLCLAPLWLCGDNGAMMAWAGLERYALGERHELGIKARARWGLEDMRAPAGVGG